LAGAGNTSGSRAEKHRIDFPKNVEQMSQIYDPNFQQKFQDNKLFGLSKAKKDSIYSNKNSIEQSVEQRNEHNIEVHLRAKKKKQRSSSTKGRESPSLMQHTSNPQIEYLIERAKELNQTVIAKNPILMNKSPSDRVRGSLNLNERMPRQESLPEMPSGFN
jgi:dipeptidase